MAYDPPAWTYTTLYGTVASVSVGENYWVDLLGFFFGGASPTGLAVNGESVTEYPRVAGAGQQVEIVLDVYGYGVSASLSLSGATSIGLAPVQPNTFITENGSVVWPPGLTNYQAARDI